MTSLGSYAHSMSPPLAAGILDLCHRHPISRAFTFWTAVDQPVQRLQRAKE
jgi:hypothetical protein